MKLSELEEGLQLIFDKEMSDQQHGGKDSFYFEQGDTTKQDNNNLLFRYKQIKFAMPKTNGLISWGFAETLETL